MILPPEKLEYKFICPLPNGLHARPANRIEQIVGGFKSSVSIENLNNNRKANAKSVLSMVGADVKDGDPCILRVSGEDCKPAYETIVSFIENELASCDEKLPDLEQESLDVCVPPVILASGAAFLTGKPVVHGFGRGQVVQMHALVVPENIENSVIDNTENEVALLDKAIVNLRHQIEQKLASKSLSKVETEVLTAQLSISSDQELVEKIKELISVEKLVAGAAIVKAYEFFAEILRTAQSELIRERIADLQDVSSQLIKSLYGDDANDTVELTVPSICVADDLSPSQFIALDKAKLKALVLANGSQTSHTVILARSYGIPTLIGVKDVCVNLTDGNEVIVDANCGLLISEINENIERFYTQEQQQLDIEQEYLSSFVDKPAKTIDGYEIAVTANIAMAKELEIAKEKGIEGVGLFRTEMLYMDSQEPPAEQEHYEQYKAAAELADGKYVTIRTFDIGGDKEVKCLNLPEEENPFLGYRGVRIYREYSDLFTSQIRAILRASAFGKLRIMIPMVCCVDEVVYVSEVISKVKEELSEAGIAFDNDIPLGINIEVPAAGFVISQMASMIKFVSLGTNDLTQYFTAVDRGNKQISSLYESRHPGFVRFVKEIVADCHKNNLKVSVCGEMAGVIDNLPLMIGLGVDELSVSAPSVLGIKAAASEVDSKQCIELVDRVISVNTAEEAIDLLSDFNNNCDEKPIVSASLIKIGADCVNKAEVIKLASITLKSDCRTNAAFDLEKDFWRREAVYSTGLGYGIAVPHCKSKFVNCNSICVFKLNKPVEWESIDGIPADVIIAMTIKDGEHSGNEHMRIFSKLARHIMHEEFRTCLRSLQTEQEIVDFLHKKLDLE